MVREGIWPARHRGPASSIVELSVTWKVIARDEWKARKECATSRRFKTARNRGPLIWAAIVEAADSLAVVVVSEAAAAGAVDAGNADVLVRTAPPGAQFPFVIFRVIS